MVEPIDPAGGGRFQILHFAPRPLAMNPFSFVGAVCGFGEGVALHVTDAADRWFDTSFSQTFRVSKGQILPAAIRVVDQSALLNRPSIMQGLFKRIENKVGFGRP